MHRRGSSLLLPSLSLNPSSSSPAAAEPPQPPRQGPRRVRKGWRQSRAPGRRGGACSGCRSCRLCPCAPGFSGLTEGLGLAPPRPSPPPLPAAARRLPSRRTSVSLALSSPQLLVLNFDFFFFWLRRERAAVGARVCGQSPLCCGAACGKLREDVDLSPRQPPGPLGCLAGLGG